MFGDLVMKFRTANKAAVMRLSALLMGFAAGFSR